MNPDKKYQIKPIQHGTVVDPKGMIDDLLDEQKDLLDQIIKLLRKLGVPNTVLQTGFLTDDNVPEEDRKRQRYVFTNSFSLVAGDHVLYSPLTPDNIFEVVVTEKKVGTPKKVGTVKK